MPRRDRSKSTNDRQRHVLVTGTSTGIGRACALRLARGLLSLGASAQFIRSGFHIASGGVTIRPIELDVTNLTSIRSAEERIRSQTGEDGLYGLVNNAGICVVGPVEFISMEAWRKQLDVNFFGVIAVTQTMLPLFRSQWRCQHDIPSEKLLTRRVQGPHPSTWVNGRMCCSEPAAAKG